MLEREEQKGVASTERPGGAEETAVGPSLRPRATPDELRERYEELDELERYVTAEEASLAELRSVMRELETRYKSAVGPRYKELDRLDAEIAEAFASLSPDDEALQERAREARERAEQTAAAVDEEQLRMESGCGMPSIGLKRLYRKIAFEMHPDRCADEREAVYRHELMIEANRAYREGDLATLESLLEEVEVATDEKVASLELRSVLHRIARARRRLLDLGREREEMQESELFELLRSFELASREGRDLFKEKLDELDRRISRTRARLEVLTAMDAAV